MSDYTEEERKLLAPSYRAVFIAVMFLVCTVDFADRTVFTVTAQTIKQELTLSDFKIGVLGGFMFAALYSFVGVPIGRMAERMNRVRIVSACTVIWSVATIWCGMAGNFVALAAGRVGVGFGEAGFNGPVGSLNSDHHVAERRASRMALILLGAPAGALLGASLGGWAADADGLGDWRYAFWILGAGGLVVAVLVWLLLREPPRGLADDAPRSPAPPPKFAAFLKRVTTKKALLFIIIGGSLASIGMTSIANFLNIFLQRVHALPPREAGALFGTLSAIALTLGLLVGSFGSDLLARFDRRWSAWAPAIGLGVAPIIYSFAFAAQTLAAATALLIAAGAVLLVYYAPALAMIQNLVEPKMRATAAAFSSMLFAMIGFGFGPPVVGYLSDRIAARAFEAAAPNTFENAAFFAACPGGAPPAGSTEALAQACASASAEGVQRALMTMVCVFFFSAIAFLLAARTLREDFYQPEAAAAETS